MGPRPKLLVTAFAAAGALGLSACTGTVQSDELAADEVAATTPSTTTTTTTTTTTVPPVPCPLDITASVSTSAKSVDIPGRTEPGHAVTVTVPSPEPVPVAADGTFTYTVAGYPVGTTTNAVVVRVEGPGCEPVERGVEIVRTSPPTTKPKKPKSNSPQPLWPPCRTADGMRVPDEWCDI